MSKSTNQKLKLNYFLTDSGSRQLIKKLETMCGHYGAGRLQHQVHVSERFRTRNESIYYMADILHQAIETGVQITFQYFNWNIRKVKRTALGEDVRIVGPPGAASKMREEAEKPLTLYDEQEEMT